MISDVENQLSNQFGIIFLTKIQFFIKIRDDEFFGLFSDYPDF